jgi:hypothetical protein
MITVAISGEEGGVLTLTARFYDPVEDIVGDGEVDLSPGEEYLGFPYALWEVHVDTLVVVHEDGDLRRIATR